MAEGQVISCHTVEAWTEELQKGNKSKKLKFQRQGDEGNSNDKPAHVGRVVVVEFTASWSGHGRVIAPVLAELAQKLPGVTFLKVDIAELKSVATDWGVQGTPSLMFLKEGKIVDKIVGPNKDELKQKIQFHAAA
ncbi:hypothetical protein NE237_016796 [Protea cynaroides]|uniref:Thioredoxin domain-containing protein n=1 Tax=Protea cynaroides TaxID=273540 RepID=A0A9Q0HIM2_9MAGN|nr:hypothetical protein NE237_016796 [Protea cynaroides]